MTKLNIPHPKTSKEELVKQKIKIQILKIEWALLGGHQIVWSLWYHTKLPTLVGGTIYWALRSLIVREI